MADAPADTPTTDIFGDPLIVTKEQVDLLVDAAHEMIGALSKTKGSPRAREWMMSIPARPDHDPDLVIIRALAAQGRYIQQLETP